MSTNEEHLKDLISASFLSDEEKGNLSEFLSAHGYEAAVEVFDEKLTHETERLWREFEKSASAVDDIFAVSEKEMAKEREALEASLVRTLESLPSTSLGSRKEAWEAHYRAIEAAERVAEDWIQKKLHATTSTASR